MRRTLAMLGLVAVLAAGTTGCSLLGGDDTPPPGSPAAAGQGSDGGGAEEGSTSTAENTAQPVLLEETLAQSELGISGATLTFEVKGVSANAHGTTLHAVITASDGDDVPLLNGLLYDEGMVPEGLPSASAGRAVNMLTLTDEGSGNVLTAAYLEDGACLCTEVPNSLDDGDSLPLFVQYAPLPEGTQTVTVGADKFGAFAHVPVTWT